MLKIQTKTRQP